MENSNKRKSEQLGMPHGTATAKLRKIILFYLLQKCRWDTCSQCGKLIHNIDELSIDHKIPWLGNDTQLFWDLDNIAFSHLSCNSAAARRPTKIYVSEKERQRIRDKRRYDKNGNRGKRKRILKI